MLTVKAISLGGDEQIYEADRVTRITVDSSASAAPGVIATSGDVLVKHFSFSGERNLDSSDDVVAVYVMNASGSTVARYHPERPRQDPA